MDHLAERRAVGRTGKFLGDGDATEAGVRLRPLKVPVRLQLSRAPGFKLQTLSRVTNGLEAVSVARPGRWGNPYLVAKHGDAAACIAQFRTELVSSPTKVAEAQRDLGGKNAMTEFTSVQQ